MNPDQVTQMQESLHNQWVWGVIAVGAMIILPFVREFWKDRRERESDRVSQLYLKSIADSNIDLAKQQTQLNIMLAANIKITDDRHAQNLIAMQHICKCQNCGNFTAREEGTPVGIAIIGQASPKFSTEKNKTKE